MSIDFPHCAQPETQLSTGGSDAQNERDRVLSVTNQKEARRSVREAVWTYVVGMSFTAVSASCFYVPFIISPETNTPYVLLFFCGIASAICALALLIRTSINSAQAQDKINFFRRAVKSYDNKLNPQRSVGRADGDSGGSIHSPSAHRSIPFEGYVK